MSTEHIDGRRLRYLHRRPELLEAVTAYVLDHGVGDLAIRPLAAAIGVSHGTLLHHFGTKENLLTEVIEVLRRRLTDAAGVTETGESIDALATWWRGSTTAERLPLYRLLFEVHALAARDPERYRRYLRQVVHDSRELMEKLVIADGCPTHQAPAVASIIVAQARGLQLDLVATGDHERTDQAFALFLQMISNLRDTWHRP
ncbi:TetR/AcrR family transcriptional regulator [Actinomadura sp. 6N118]|uniref:TetR/AcrR family transcriptional regulator n=1 Tax=Actinomadura sp. 6N118 TaxID=3375151 RepID=UPI0037BCC20D